MQRHVPVVAFVVFTPLLSFFRFLRVTLEVGRTTAVGCCTHVDFLTENYHERSIDFIYGKVSMPIISARLWNKDGHRSILEADSGEYVHVAKQEADPIVVRHGVYFIKMRVDNSLISEASADFVRPGNP